MFLIYQMGLNQKPTAEKKRVSFFSQEGGGGRPHLRQTPLEADPLLDAHRLEGTWNQTRSDIIHPLVLISSGSHCSGWYASYWNAFLSSLCFPLPKAVFQTAADLKLQVLSIKYKELLAVSAPYVQLVVERYKLGIKEMSKGKTFHFPYFNYITCHQIGFNFCNTQNW